jgi:DNA-directed RNA polymerase specialized sigma24 family protein
MNSAVCLLEARSASAPVHVPETCNERASRSVVGPWLSGRSALLSLCLRWTRGNRAEAEDLLGDACVRILEGDYRVGAELGSPIAFWATVINNLGRDRIRRTKRWKPESPGDDAGVLGALPAPTIGAEQQLFLRECLAATARKLTRLTDKQCTALLLRSRGLDYSVIGESLHTTAANARKLVETARRLLNSPRPRTEAAVRGSSAFPMRERRSYVVES